MPSEVTKKTRKKSLKHNLQVTLVEEGTWGGRFRHREEYRYLRHVEKDFAHMITELQKTDKKIWQSSERDVDEQEEEVDSDTDS